MRRNSQSLPAIDARGNAKVVVIAVVAVALLAVVAYFVLSGGGGGSDVTSRFIPKEASVVGSVNVAGLLKSPMYKHVEPMVKEAQEGAEYKAIQEKTGFQLDQLHTVAFGMTDVGATGGEPAGVAAITGSFDANKLIAEAKSSMGEGAEETDISGVKFVSSPGDPGGVAAFDASTLLAGTKDAVGKAVQVAGGSAESTAKNEGLAAVRKRIDTGATFWVVGAVPKEAMAMGEGMLPPGMDAIKKLTHGGMSVDLKSGVAIKVVGELGTEEDAKAVAAQVQGLLGMARGFGMGAVPEEMKADVNKVLDGITFGNDGTAAVITVSVDQATVDTLVEAAKKQGLVP
jgi:hypothetical protein